MAAARGYARLAFYKPCGMEHWCPEGAPGEMDYSGQNNDGLFDLSFRRRATCLVGDVDRFEPTGLVLKSGERLPADVVVVAAGCKTVLQPSFLKELDVGFHDVHNFAFLGPNPRIGCAADFVFGFVPAGPMAQLSMAFRSFALCRERGAEGEELVRRALEPTTMIPPGDEEAKGGRMAGQHTWFESRHWWSPYSCSVEERADVYARTMCLGRSRGALVLFKAKLKAAVFGLWILCSVLGLYEFFRYPSFLFARRPPASELEEKRSLDRGSASPSKVKASKNKVVGGKML
ncbi:hypothetical protein H632_c3095p0 [Helicosporidium sp. ATCC 50920]|nr:hypothetical protein H632_c3095p0 [Helicosporidium sp. ATCC 50920]|eukprot:KDD72635.1 hypothetical protein H632_c3095p0 [Helicosporidium sp. ATCC 50920]